MWSTTHHVQVSIVNPDNNSDDVTGERPICYQMMEQTHVFDTNLQKELLSEYKRNSKNKSQKYANIVLDKKALIIILFRQCEKATKTELLSEQLAQRTAMLEAFQLLLSKCALFILAEMTVAYHTGPINKL